MNTTQETASLLKDRCLINGEWVASAAGASIQVSNPADGTLVGSVPRMGRQETTLAIDAAVAALGPWRACTAKERGEVLLRWYALMRSHAEELAVLMTREQGKILREARGEVEYAASFVQWFAEEGKRAYGENIPSPARDKRLMVIKQPVGVCALVTPWNFPAAMITRKAAPALAAGCTVVVKPASQTPLTALALAELAQRAGVPPGVFNVVTGSAGEIGEVLTQDRRVAKLSFTGSTEVGRTLMAQCAPTIKKLSLELGGNAPFIVFDDADLDAAVEGAIASKFRNSGQTCVCTNRILVQASVYDDFAQRLARRVTGLRVGNGCDEGNDQGPLIDGKAVQKIAEHIADAVDKGGRVLVGGQSAALGGNFFEPTVIVDATPEMLCAQEETFGPLAALFRFDTEEQAIRMANDTEVGLAAYFYSRDISRCLRVSEALESGMVGVNTGLISNEVAPFGGIKQSGIGREGSRYGLDEYMETKYICLGM
jgi:succinate-semialdehyde dehydrogenase / glutarate-semialdehyde dehydrogenase